MKLFEALIPVEHEIDDKLGIERAFERSWNLDYPISISLSVAECRAIIVAMKEAREFLSK